MTPTRICARTSGSSGACSATPSASRRAPRCSIWSRASAARRSTTARSTIAPSLQAAGADDRRGWARRTRPTSCARSATSITWPTPPRICTRAGAQPRARGRIAQRAASGCAPRTCRRARSSSFFERARVEPVLTAHPTEVQRKSILDRHRARDRSAGGARRDGRPDDDREGAAARGPAAVEDQRAAPVQADRRRRDRERAHLLPVDLPGGDPAPLRRDRGRPRVRDARWRRSCASRAGSAAIATATRTSPPR